MEPFPYRIERLTSSRLPDLQRLLREVLHKNVSLDYLGIKYDTHATGHQYLSSIAYDGVRPVAFYGTIPQAFTNANGDRLIGCHVSDSMTLENYRRRGLHQQLALAAYNWMRAEGVALVYAFHGENTYYSSKKLDWKDWGRLRGYWVRIPGFASAKLWRRLPVFRNWHRRRVQSILTQYTAPESAYHNSQTGLGIAVDYSPSFVASKAFHANFWITLKGVIFWLSVDAVVRVGDAHFVNAAQFQAGLGELQQLCRKLGFGQILFQTYAGSPLDKALLDSGYNNFESWMVGYLDFAEGLDFTQYNPSYADQDSF